MPKKFQFDDPSFDDAPITGGVVPYEPADEPPVSAVAATLRQHEGTLMAIPGVKSVGEGRGPIGEPVIEVGIAHPGVAQAVPHAVGGVGVVTRVVGEVDAYARPRRPVR